MALVIMRIGLAKLMLMEVRMARNGLDKNMVSRMRDVLIEEKQKGKTHFFSL